MIHSYKLFVVFQIVEVLVSWVELIITLRSSPIIGGGCGEINNKFTMLKPKVDKIASFCGVCDYNLMSLAFLPKAHLKFLVQR